MLLFTDVNRKWTDAHVVSMEIESRGRLTVAKLYGVAYARWDGFGLWWPYHPLLISE